MLSSFYIHLRNPGCYYYPFRGGWGFYYFKGFHNGSFIKFLKWYFKKKLQNHRTVKYNLKKLKESKIPFVRKGLVCEFRNPNYPQVDFHLGCGKWKRTTAQNYNHRKISGSDGFLIWYFDPDYEDPKASYDRITTFSISAFEDFYKTLSQNHVLRLDGYTIKNTPRYKVFHKNIKCAFCGIEGQYYALETERHNAGTHFNFYAVNQQGHEILMTADHIIPVSKGGTKGVDNLQTMCKPCNSKKADKV